jgi:alpha-galactosidase
VPILRSDYVGDPYQPDFDPLTQQNHIHGISFWMPYHGSGFSAIDPYVVRSLMGPIVGIGVDTRRKDLDYALLRKLCQQYRQISACYLGDYYTLTPYRKTADVWAARQFDRPDAGEGIVQAFRRKDCMEESQVFKLRGLAPQAAYSMEDMDTGKSETRTGRQWMDEGLAVNLDNRPSAAIFTYRRMK